jgi:hypothetical protein
VTDISLDRLDYSNPRSLYIVANGHTYFSAVCVLLVSSAFSIATTIFVSSIFDSIFATLFSSPYINKPQEIMADTPFITTSSIATTKTMSLASSSAASSASSSSSSTRRKTILALSTTLVLLLLPFLLLGLLLTTSSFPSSFSFLASSSSSFSRPQLRAAAAAERQNIPADPSIGDSAADGFLVQDHPVVYPKNSSSTISSSFADAQPTEQQRFLQASGTRTVLVIRVMAADRTPTASIASLQQYIFTNTNSLANQMNRCSAGTVLLVRRLICSLCTTQTARCGCCCLFVACYCCFVVCLSLP